MQDFANKSERQLDKDAWLVKAREALEQIPEDTLALHLVEKRTILLALIFVQGNRSRAARLLQISKRNIYNKLKKYKL